MLKFFLNSKVNAKIAAGLMAVVAVAGVGLKLKESHATATALTGQCGMLFTANFTGLLNNTAVSPNSGWTTGGLIYFNFDTGSVAVRKNYITNFGNTTATVGEVDNPLAGGMSPVTLDSSGIFYSANMSNGARISFLPVNGGNTYLISWGGVTDNTGVRSIPAMGVCQKV